MTVFAFLFRMLACITICYATTTLADQPEGDHVLSRDIYRDATGRTSLSEIINAPFTPSQEIFAGGYTSDVVWMRLLVQPALYGGPQVLRILPAYLNEITLYEPDDNQPGGWRASTTGNGTPWRTRPMATISLGFPINPATPTTYYLRLRTDSNSMLQVQALTVNEASRSEVVDMLWQGLYLALILGVAFWAIHDYWQTRDRIIRIFIGVYLVFPLYILAILGYLSPLLPEADWIPLVTSWSVTLLTLATLLFHRNLLLLFDVGQTARWLLNSLICIELIANTLLLAGHASAALALNSLVGLLAAPVLFIVALAARTEAAPGRKQLRLYYGLLCAALASFFAPVLGLSSLSAPALYGALFQGVVSALLFGSLLHARARQLVAQQLAAQQQLKLSAYELERHKHQLAEQGRFTAMLTHEIRNPLAAIRLNVDTLQQTTPPAQKHLQRIDRALHDINTLVDRCALSDHMEQGHYEVRLASIDVAWLIADWQAQHPEISRLRVIGDSGPVPVTSDPQLLAVAIANLLDNAIKYSPPDTPVEVSVRVTPAADGTENLCLDIANQPGPAGFPDGERAFEKYHRGPATSRHAGSGLGLYLVKGITEQLGGRITCLSQPDRIVFHLCLPLNLR